MRKVIEYMLVEGEYENNFNIKINRLMSEGWEVYGYPSVATKPYSTKFIQAMVKYEVQRMNNPTPPTNNFPEGTFEL